MYSKFTNKYFSFWWIIIEILLLKTGNYHYKGKKIGVSSLERPKNYFFRAGVITFTSIWVQF